MKCLGKELLGNETVNFVTALCRNLGRCAELLLLHFSSFTIGRRLEVFVSSVEEELLKPCAPYCPAALLPTPAPHNPAQVVTVVAPAPPVRWAFQQRPENKSIRVNVFSNNSSDVNSYIVTSELVCIEECLFYYVFLFRLVRRHLPNFLGSYPVPQALRDCVEAKTDVLVVQPALGEVRKNLQGLPTQNKVSDLKCVWKQTPYFF